jgi:hypothetical protein
LVALCAAVQVLAKGFAHVLGIGVNHVGVLAGHRHAAAPRGTGGMLRRLGSSWGTRQSGSLLGVLAGLLSPPGFVRHWLMLDGVGLVSAWLVFALANL